MSLLPGASLGPYQVIAPIGAGGMGEVYRARDSKLNRDVAIKVLPELFAADPDRLARFTREAQILAALNHPNIAAIYGVESNALVMELVEGDDLSELIARGPIPAAEALPIARQIAEALEAAHELGIVHRDLKPGNVKVRADSAVKVLDFGLARGMDPAATSSVDAMRSPTLTARATQLGVILGTAAYMAPEQARGKPVDKRADIWAFGVVLYEMLTGRRAFPGDEISDVLAAVLRQDIDWSALPAGTSPSVRRLLERCLERDTKRRLRDIGEARLVLEAPTALDAAFAVAPPPAVAPARAGSRVWQAAAVLFALTTIAGAAAWYRSIASPVVARFLIAPPEKMAFTAGAVTYTTLPAISPDGRTVAFTAQDAEGKRLLWLRLIDGLVAQPMPGTEGASYPFWSPDSRFIAYAITGKLMKVSANGGPPTTLCALNAGIISRGGSWNRDGVLIFNNGPVPLYRVSASGGDASVMGGQGPQEFPAFLPDGRHYLFHSAGSQEKSGVYVASLDGGAATRVVSSSSGAVYDRKSGHILFVRQGTLLAQMFDVGKLAVTGEPFPVAEGVEASAVPGLAAFAVSDTGVLVYGLGDPAGVGLQLTWVDRTGKALGTVGAVAPYRGFNLSPDDSQVVAHTHEGDGGDVWLMDVARGTTARFTFDASQENASPIWSPDGRRIAFSSVRNGNPGIYVKPANNSGAEQQVLEVPGIRTVLPLSWSPDGGSILFQMPGVQTSSDVWMLPLSGKPKPVPLLQSPFTESYGQISPDGRWLAYQSNETGVLQIYVRPVSGTGGKWPVSTVSGTTPRWRADSRELFYISGGKLWAVDVTTKGDVFDAGSPKLLFEYSGIGNFASHPAYFPYAVAKDGQRLLVPRGPTGPDAVPHSSPIVVILNWLEGAKK